MIHKNLILTRSTSFEEKKMQMSVVLLGRTFDRAVNRLTDSSYAINRAAELRHTYRDIWNGASKSHTYYTFVFSRGQQIATITRKASHTKSQLCSADWTHTNHLEPAITLSVVVILSDSAHSGNLQFTQRPNALHQRLSSLPIPSHQRRWGGRCAFAVDALLVFLAHFTYQKIPSKYLVCAMVCMCVWAISQPPEQNYSRK